MRTLWNADCPYRPSLSRGNFRTCDDGLTLTVCSASDSPALVHLSEPARLKRSARHIFFPHGLIPRIEAILTSKDGVKMVDDLLGDDAQAFIDVMHEVRSPLLHIGGTV